MRKCSEMPYHTGIVLRIYPSRRQKRIVSVNDGCSRAVYNRLVALNKERYEISKTAMLVPVYRERLSYIDSILRNPDTALPAALKTSMPFLYGEDVDSLAIDNAIKHYRAAWKKFREDPRAGVPAFHRKSYEQSYQTNAHYYKGSENINNANVRFEDMNHIILPVIGKIRISGSKKRLKDIINRDATRIGTITISCDTIGRYFVSLQLASEQPFTELLHPTGGIVGIDMNIENFLWDSNGNEIANPKFRRNEKQHVASLQRSLSRKARRAKKEKRSLYTSKNYQKNRRELSKLQLKVSRRSDDFRHVVSKRYVESQDYIFAEDLKVKNLLKNHKLAYAISECGWSDFLGKLEYKSAMYGRTFLKVPPARTTQTCSSCGYVLTGKDKLTPGDREWVCPKCGTYHVRDYNAAKNIRARGVAALGIIPA